MGSSMESSTWWMLPIQGCTCSHHPLGTALQSFSGYCTCGLCCTSGCCWLRLCVLTAVLCSLFWGITVAQGERSAGTRGFTEQTGDQRRGSALTINGLKLWAGDRAGRQAQVTAVSPAVSEGWLQRHEGEDTSINHGKTKEPPWERCRWSSINKGDCSCWWDRRDRWGQNLFKVNPRVQSLYTFHSALRIWLGLAQFELTG